MTDEVRNFTQISQLNVTQHIQPPLLQLVHEQDELAGGARVGHHQQHLGPPELHVVFPHIQHQQILPHLNHKEMDRWRKKSLFFKIKCEC